MTTTAEETPALKLRSGYEYSNEGRDPNPLPQESSDEVNEEVKKKILTALREVRELNERKKRRVAMALKFYFFVLWFCEGIVPKFSLLIFLPISIWFSIDPNLWMLVFFAELTIRILSDEYHRLLLAKGAQNAVVSQDTVRKYDGL